ncbi:MAG: hypothetical protein WCY05_03695 [Candidatus Omnitrophota bacterium]
MIKSTKQYNGVLAFEFSVKESEVTLVPNVNLAVCQIFFKDFQDYIKKEYQVSNCENGFFNTFKTTILGEDNVIKKIAVVDKDVAYWEYRANFSTEVPVKKIPLQENKSNKSRHLNQS